MQTLQISIDEMDFLKYGFEKSNLSFAEFIEKIQLELARQALQKCQEIAEKVGLASMTLEEINAEIKAVRDAKSDSGY